MAKANTISKTNNGQNVTGIQWMYYPRNLPIDVVSKRIVNVFSINYGQISSHNHTLESNDVLAIVRNDLQNLGFTVEQQNPQIRVKVPVLYEKNGAVGKSFFADAYSADAYNSPTNPKGYVIEVEAGRAVTNYQFLKDFFEGCTMVGVDKICIVVRNIYREKHPDFEKVCDFFDALYTSGRLKLPISGLLIIGY
jgi:hypothetical protein